jgi:hypothetical protein
MTTMNQTGSPLDQKVAELIAQLEMKTDNPDRKREILVYVQQQLHNILPEGNWLQTTTREQILKEVERVKTLQEKNIAEDPKASFRAAMAIGKEKHLNKQK